MVNLFTAHLTAQDEVETVIGTDWFERENFGTRFLSERDFPLDVVDADAPTAEDWDFFYETTFVDPAEREW